MQKITDQGKVLAFIIGKEWPEGTAPLTEETYPLQIMSLNHPQGKILAAHRHEPKTRTTSQLMESLMVISGKIKATIFNDNKPVEDVILETGQGLMLINGGIKITFLENAKCLEFKNGPFVEDKVLLEE